MTFAEKLRSLMHKNGWTVEKTAEEAGLKAGAVKSYLLNGGGKRYPTLKAARALAHAFGKTTAIFDECEDLDVDSTEGGDKKAPPDKK